MRHGEISLVMLIHCSVMNFVGHEYQKKRSRSDNNADEDEETVDSADDVGP